MLSNLDLMYDNPVHVSGHTIFTMTNNIADKSYWVLKVYADLKFLNFCLAPAFKEFLIHRPRIFDLRLC